jgi:3-hydroxymyristoyl/3-hydroxydecanoyl-(acyl carrier protein) dehydratase
VKAKILRQIKEVLRVYGIPLGQYKAEVGPEDEITYYVVLTHKKTGAKIYVDNIYVSKEGVVSQWDHPVLG